MERYGRFFASVEHDAQCSDRSYGSSGSATLSTVAATAARAVV
jgi:hypothetical protein